MGEGKKTKDIIVKKRNGILLKKEELIITMKMVRS